MKFYFAILLGLVISAGALGAGPDFPEHGFSSRMPSASNWVVKQQLDDAEHDTIIRGYVDASGERSIVLLVGKNNTSERQLFTFAARYMARIKQSAHIRVVSEAAGSLGGIPSRILQGDVELATGQTKHTTWIIALQGEKLYSVTLGSIKTKVEEDEMLAEYLRSIRISKK